MLFSICIPNFNYAHYVGDTIRSVIDQGVEVEVLVADNASTDGSVALIEGFGDPRIRVSANQWNVGFAGNLDKACAGATGERMILLSSDDLAEPEALPTYQRLAEALGGRHHRTVFASSQHIIDGEGKRTGLMGRDLRLWKGARQDVALSAIAGAPVWRIDAATLLANSLRYMRPPFAFAPTCYPRELYESVEGYGGGRLYNPDKAFAWKLLTRADDAIHVDAPLFSYRVHNANQDAQQAKAGALKHLVDEYVASFDTAPETLVKAGVSKDELASAFVEQDVALRGLKMLAEGRRGDARRTVDFGKAAYPALIRGNRKIWALRGLLLLGPLGTAIARRAYSGAVERFRQGD